MRADHKGYSLVELLIAITLGGLLMAAMLHLLMSQRQLAAQINDTAQLSERIGFASLFLSRHVMEAGYAPAHLEAPQPVQFSGIRGSRDKGLTDTLTILSEGGRGCTDQLLENNAGTEWRMFSVHRDAGKFELRCEDSEGGPYPMMEGVEAMQVQYGIDRDNNQAPEFYASAAQVPAECPIAAIRIGLLLRAETPMQTTAPPRETKLLDLSLTGSGKQGIDFSDGRVRRSMIVTIALRNSGHVQSM